MPSCPAWTIADLVWHLGEVHWFWATDVDLAATNPDQVEAAKPARPEDSTDLVAWGRDQTALLLRVLESAPDERRVWTWAQVQQQATGRARRAGRSRAGTSGARRAPRA